MSPEEIIAAQNPIHGWDRQTRAFSPTAGIDAAPRWADFKDPLEAISGRARARRPMQRADGNVFTPEERRSLEVLRMSRATQDIFGYDPDELIGRNIKMLMPEDVAKHHDGTLVVDSRPGRTVFRFEMPLVQEEEED